jgi:hypothetical protein
MRGVSGTDLRNNNSSHAGQARLGRKLLSLQEVIYALSECGEAVESSMRSYLASITSIDAGAVQHGDTLVVWCLDQPGRSMRHLANLIKNLKARGTRFWSISDSDEMIDTTSASGELVLNIFSALGQFERRLIRERTKAGLVAARARGR